MGAYEYVSGIAVLIYFFIFLIFLNSKRSKVRDAFLWLILFSILWSGGSLLMRKQAFPNYEFWYHVSLAGLLFMPVVYFRFIMEYIRDVKKLTIYIYTALMGIALSLNAITGVFIPPPIIERINGNDVMVYEQLGWHVYILYGLGGLIIVHMLVRFYIGVRNNPKLKKLVKPIVFGIIVTFVGNLLLLFPVFSSFPVDILAGIITSFALLYALLKTNPFQLKMIFSESVGYATCILLGFLSIYTLNPMIVTLLTNNNVAFESWTVWYLITFSAFVVTYFVIWKGVIVSIFVREEDEKSELLNIFASSITKSLDSELIFRETMSIIEKIAGTHRIHVALKEDKHSFRYTYSNQTLADLSATFRTDNPLVKLLENSNTFVRIEDFQFEASYQTMWDQEKYDLVRMDITYAFGIIHDGQMHGVLMVSDLYSKKKMTHHQLLQLQSICTMVSIALKNSASYEAALIEARTDDLTGLYNRKYFYKLIDNEFENKSNDSVAMVMINLDDFKLYNQLFGVVKADKALETIATIVKGTVGRDGHVSRYSGKEFTIILPKYDVNNTLRLVEKIRSQILSTSEASGKQLEKHITTSIGVCVYPYGASNINELIDNVQQAVYQIKRNGKNSIKVFDTYIQDGDNQEKRSYSSIYDDYKSTIYALTAAIDAKDHYTFSHSENVANYGVALAKELNLNDEIVENVRQAALLHDIGKISIPEHVLNKPGRLNGSEFKIMQGHVDASIDIIRHLPSLDYVIPAVLAHHERYDGTGYPRQTKGDDIPITAKILTIVDSFDAMVSGRVYKDAMPIDKVMNIIRDESGKQFDPKLVDVFVGMVEANKISVSQTIFKTTKNVNTVALSPQIM